MSENRVTPQIKQTVAKRAKNSCEYCLSQACFAIQPFSIEHITPKSRGGLTNLDNLALACQGCNNYKYNKIEGQDPVTGNLFPLYHPRQHKWSEHFTWNEDFTQIIGVTPIGRTTVEVLKLNRDGVVNLRRILYKIGEHPPM